MTLKTRKILIQNYKIYRNPHIVFFRDFEIKQITTYIITSAKYQLMKTVFEIPMPLF